MNESGSHTRPRAARQPVANRTQWAVTGSFQKPQRQFERMAADASKHLDRAKRFLGKNRDRVLLLVACDLFQFNAA